MQSDRQPRREAEPSFVAPPPRYRITAIAALGGRPGFVTDLNNKAEVVGGIGESLLLTRPFIYSRGKAQILGHRAARFFLASGINHRGQVAVSVNEVTKPPRAALWEGGAMRDLDTPSGAPSFAAGINDAGQIVGWYGREERDSRAFLWERGRLRALRIAGTNRYSLALAINNRGQIVGSGHEADRGGPLAFLWDKGRTIPLGYGTAGAVNDQGQAVGQSGSVAALWQEGRQTDLDVPPGKRLSGSCALDINNRGQIVGNCFSERPQYAILWLNGRPYLLDDLIPSGTGWKLTSASAINDLGQIAGSGTLNGKPCLFLLTPQ